MNSKFTLCAFADEACSSLEGQISAMCDNGIDFLEIRGVDNRNISALNLNDAKSIGEKLKQHGLAVWSIGSPSGKIDISDDFAPHFDKFRNMLELAGVLGASHYRLFSFYGTKNSEAARDVVMERLSKFCDAAKGSGIILCHENEKDIYGEMAEGCADIHRTLPEIRAIFDPANFVQAGQETLPAWEILSPYVEYMHIKDARVDGSVVPSGYGDGHIPELLEKYAALGGKVLTLEPHLSVFNGLDELEHGAKSEVGSFRYPSQRAAFDAAVDALKKLL